MIDGFRRALFILLAAAYSRRWPVDSEYHVNNGRPNERHLVRDGIVSSVSCWQAKEQRLCVFLNTIWYRSWNNV